MFGQIEKAVKKESDAFKKAYSELKSELSPDEILVEAGFNGFKFNINSFLAEYKINLLLATKAEENMDMSSIMDMCREVQNTATDNALTFLINQQGHELSELKEENPDNGFVKSVIADVFNKEDMYPLIEFLESNLPSYEEFVDIVEFLISFEDKLYIGIIDCDRDPQWEIGKNRINYYIAADDQMLKEFTARTDLLEANIESENSINMYVNAYPDHTEVVLEYNYKEYKVSLTDDEESQLKEEIKKWVWISRTIYRKWSPIRTATFLCRPH